MNMNKFLTSIALILALTTSSYVAAYEQQDYTCTGDHSVEWNEDSMAVKDTRARLSITGDDYEIKHQIVDRWGDKGSLYYYKNLFWILARDTQIAILIDRKTGEHYICT